MENAPGYPNAQGHDRLRSNAEELIAKGGTPRVRGGALSVDALTLLYKRASMPESGADALKLLHELQTHQVELDLIYEQLQANEQELTEELSHYRQLYEYAPAAYLILANDGQILEGNHSAGELLGESAMALVGKTVWEFVASGQEAVINRLLQAPGERSPDSPATKTSFVEFADRRRLLINATHVVSKDSVLMILTELTQDACEP